MSKELDVTSARFINKSEEGAAGAQMTHVYYALAADAYAPWCKLIKEKYKLELEVTCPIFGNVTKDATVYLFAKGTDGVQSGDILHQAALELGVDYEVADVCKLWNLQRKASAPSKMMI